MKFNAYEEKPIQEIEESDRLTDLDFGYIAGKDRTYDPTYALGASINWLKMRIPLTFRHP